MQLSLLLVFLLVAGFWSVIKYIGLRTFDASDEPWGLLSLLTLLVFIAYEGRSPSGSRQHSPRDFHNAFLVLAVSLSILIAGYWILPNLVQGVLFAFTLFLILEFSGLMSSRWGALSLLILSLPLMPSLNFYFAFPLRLLCSSIASVALQFCGFAVKQEANLLYFNGQVLSVDAPCSGISMLWASAYLCSLLIYWYRLSARRSALLFAAGFLLVILSNSMRVAALSIYSFKSSALLTGSVNLEPAVHLFSGLSLFAFLSLLLVVIAAKLKSPELVLKTTVTEPIAKPVSPRLLAFTMLATLLAALLPLLPREAKENVLAELRWPEQIEGRKVEHLSSQDSDFDKGFPGRIGKFSDGRNIYLLRFINSASRQVHSARDCYRGMGYTIDNGPLIRNEDGQLFSSFYAVKDKRRYRVRERIYDEHGRFWTDPSDWYWSVMLGKSQAPWWDLTVSEPL